jgi:tRNA splicing endonuclease
MDPALEQRKPKGKKRWRQDINTNHLQLYGQLKPRNLHGVILDAAVYITVEDDIVHMLDCLCLGNLDGGSGTADHVRRLLHAAGVDIPGDKAVRLSLDEAFFMAYALEVLIVHNEAGDKAVRLDTVALWQQLQAARPDFLMLYLAYHHFRSKVRARGPHFTFCTRHTLREVCSSGARPRSLAGLFRPPLTQPQCPTCCLPPQGWIARTGLQYGADCVLYQRHPALAHSDYSVLILPADGASAKGAVARPRMHWHDLQVANRLSTQVGKRLLLFYVRESGAGDYSSPGCLANFAVHERVVRRWVPESQRPV